MSSTFEGGATAGRVDAVGKPRLVRVNFPVRVSFEGVDFTVDELTLNLSVGGVFLPTSETAIPVRTRGSLTFRPSQWDEPFTVTAEVVWSAVQGQVPEDQPAGVGLTFIDLTDDHRRRLQRLLGGIRDGSVTEAIRRSLSRPGTTLSQELRKRPTDQKAMFAVAARSTEIDALIQDGTQAAILRLLRNPRLNLHQVRKIVGDPRTRVSILLEIFREKKWMRDGQVLLLFCLNPLAPLDRIQAILPRLPLNHLKQVAANRALRKPVLDRAEQLLKTRSG